MNNKLDYSQLDANILTWGVAQHAGDKFTVTAYRRRELAEKAASTAPRVTGAGTREQTGRVITFRNVEPLVYHHPDLSWVLAAVGWPVAT